MSEYFEDYFGGLRGLNRALALTAFVIVAFTVMGLGLRLPLPTKGAIYIGLFTLLYFLVLRRLRFDGGTVAILLAGFGFYLSYLGYTEFGERNYDGGAQLDYIKYIVEHRAIPPAAHCFICHHPPAYYVLAAGSFKLFEKAKIADPILGVQLFSLLSFLVFVVFGVLTVRRFTTQKRFVRLAALLIVFWPYSYQMCVRVHNDSLASTWMVVGLYFLVRWHQENRALDILLAALFAALGVLTKSSAYVLVAVVLGLVGWRFLWRRDRLRTLGRGVAVLVIVAMAGSFNAIIRTKGPATAGGLCHRVLGTACDINKNDFVGNRPFNYVYFDLKSFFKEPYIVIDRKETGTNFFWNDLIKSSLFATHNKTPDPETAYSVNRAVGLVENWLLFAMTLYLLLAVIHFRRTVVRRYGAVVLVLASSVVGLAAFRAIIPAPHHNDFRHVFHVLVPMATLYAMAVGGYRARGTRMAALGEWLAVPFVAISIFYFLPKYHLVMRLTQHTVTKSLASYSKLAKEGKAWDEAPNLLFEGNEIVEFDLPAPRPVSQIDVSLDNNDRYEFTLYGEKEKRAVLVGPKKGSGLARYLQAVDPPVQGVRKVTMRAVSGDCAYAMGHLVLR